MRTPRSLAFVSLIAGVATAACGEAAPSSLAAPTVGAAPATPGSSPGSSPVVGRTDAGAASPRPTGEPPLLLADSHAPKWAAWLPNGHLLLVTKRDLLDIDPERPLDVWRRTALAHDVLRFVGAAGADRFVLLDETGTTLWDATKIAPMASIGEAPAKNRPPPDLSLSKDGARIALLDLAGSAVIVDARSGRKIATLAGPRDDQPASRVLLDDTGALVFVSTGEHVDVDDVATGRRILTRGIPHFVSRGLGESDEICERRGDRLYMSSQSGIEVIALPSGKTIARTKSEKLMNAVALGLSADGTQVFGDGYAWDARPGGRVRPVGGIVPRRRSDRMDPGPDTFKRPDGHFTLVASKTAFAVSDAAGLAVLTLGAGSPYDGETLGARPLRLDNGDVRFRSDRSKNEVVLSQAPKPWNPGPPKPSTSGTPVQQSFDDPWVLTRRTTKAPGDIVNVHTLEKSALVPPSECDHPIGPDSPIVVAMPTEPAVLCVTPRGVVFASASGLRRTFPLPLPSVDTPFGAAKYAGHLGDRLFFTFPQVSAYGLARAFRYDVTRSTEAQIYVAQRAAIVRFADGMVERFGQVDEAEPLLRCVTPDGLAPFARCSSDWETQGRFEDPDR